MPVLATINYLSCIMTTNIILEHIRKFVPFSKEEEVVLLPYLNLKSVKKKEYLLKEGQICTANHFVVKGCLRMFYITEEGNEQMIQFAIDNWWMTDYMSFDSQKPTQFNIQAVENSEIIFLEKKRWRNYLPDCQNWNVTSASLYKKRMPLL